MYRPAHSRWLLISVLITASCYTSAATFCVSTSAQLINSLITAESNGETDEIRLKTGNYIIPFEQSFTYIAPDSETFGLKITGGWIDFLNNQCSLQPGFALNTAIDGNFGDRAFYIVPKGSQTIEITGLTFTNGVVIGENGGGLNIDAPISGGFVPVGFDGTILVENNAFIANTAESGSAINITGANKIIVRNNLVVENLATLNSAVSLNNQSRRGIYFTNNTVMSNTSLGVSNIVAAVSMYTSGTSQGFIANNILWNDNDVLDLYFEDLENSGDYFLYNNDIGSYLGFTMNEANNISATPEFQPGVDNYTPEYNGNLFNQGIEPPTFSPIPIPFESDWDEGDEDFTAMERIYGTIDIGAVEAANDIIFKNGFDGSQP